MRVLWEAEPFTDFGPDPFSPSERRPRTTIVSGQSKSELRRAVHARCPNAPGVYGMLDPAGTLIYVGKSKSLRRRLLGYFRPDNGRGKEGAILRETRRLIWERRPSEFAAMLRELYLIRTWRPQWNVKDQPKAHKPLYVCLGRRPARYLFATTNPPGGAPRFGPLSGRGRVNAAVDALNRHYQLRDCRGNIPLFFSDQAELFPAERRPGCLRYEIGTCHGPCVGATTRRRYAASERGARAFLEGEDEGPVIALGERMERAAAEQRYETAARLRDRLGALEWLSERLAYLQQARQRFNFIYPVRSHSGGQIWYAIHRGCVARALRGPSARHQRSADLELLERWLQTGRLDEYPLPERHPTITLLTSWFRNREWEWDRVMSMEEALERYRECAAGGVRAIGC